MTAVVFLALIATEELKGELRVPADGAKVTIDLSVLKTVLPRDRVPQDASGFTVEGKAAEGWTVEVADVKPGKEVLIVHVKMDLKVSISVGAAEKGIFAIEGLKLFGREAYSVRYSPVQGAGSEGKVPAGFTVSEKEGKAAVNGVPLAALSPLARGPSSSFYVLRPSSLLPWVAVGEKYYKALVDDDTKTFTECYAKRDQATMDRAGGKLRMHWAAGRRWIDDSKVVAYEYLRTDTKKSTDVKKRIHFARADASGKHVGFQTLLVLELEDGAWVLTSASQ